ncbi:hypothetical protein [Candidatus Francisella endociliophora]|uniref:hypothetical protein n=1 Tax=Candidatus Francisella endociliophora TaxID=653937 RepID=UPI00069378BE|nr:hypothetical protein [Francisella sp. FSC1006]
MIKKIITATSLTLMLVTFSFANTQEQANPIQKQQQVYSGTPAATAASGPFTAIGIGLTSILMIPVGFFKGAADGFNTPADQLSSNPIISPLQRVGAAAVGSVSGAVSYPMQTSQELTQKARENNYIA